MDYTGKTVAVGCDHGGYELKLEIIRHLEERGIKYRDFGCDSTESVNYPIYAHAVCEAIQKEECACGILCCGTGIGMSMAANKHDGIRAAVCTDTFSARMTRLHNDCNCLCLGGRVLGFGLALDIVDLFLDTGFMGGRHAERIAMLPKYGK
ncbi:MAG: ribose 5-phosphate isomerase B [Clostridiales bacterium]|nr:ribose 5-phosphate isomerase B [Clostridiales bacterium]